MIGKQSTSCEPFQLFVDLLCDWQKPSAHLRSSICIHDQSELNTMAGHQRPLFVLFGASMTEYSFERGGWGAELANLYCRKADILLRGYKGWNTRRALAVLEQFFPKEFPLQPALVVVFFGANDAAFPMPSGRGQHVPIPEFKENLRLISTYLKGLSKKTRVILVTCPPIYEDGRREYARIRWGIKSGDCVDRTNERAKEYAEACVEVAKEVDVGVVDLWSSIQKRNNWQTECLSDGMHLSAEGNKALIEELLQLLKSVDWSPCLHLESIAIDFPEPSAYDYVHPSWELANGSN